MKPSWKTLASLAVAIAAALALSTSALAIGPGSRSGPAPAQWRIVLGQTTWSGKLSALYPGALVDTELLHFTVTNRGRAAQRLDRVTVSMPTGPRGDAETATGADIPGCRAGWFTLSVDRGDGRLPVEIAPARSYAGMADLSMRDSGGNEDACRGAAPAITINAGT